MEIELSAVLTILEERGGQQYGLEAVTQLEHALQCATLAEAAGQSAEVIAACLLHDLGHLVHNLGEDAANRQIDDCHELRALPWLTPLFSSAVTEPIRLHVSAKRYLCAVEPAYWQTLSVASQQTLQLQGGAFSAKEAKQFIQQPHAAVAVQLRRWDEAAKVPGLQTPDLQHFSLILSHCLPEERLRE